MDLVQSAAAARRAMEISDRLDDKGLWAEEAGEYAMCLVMRGNLKEGFVLVSQAFATAVQNSRQGLAIVWTAGACSSWLGDPRGARGWFELEQKRPINAHSPVRLQQLSFLIDTTYFEEGQLNAPSPRLTGWRPSAAAGGSRAP